MPRFVPEAPTFSTTSRREVCKRLTHGLGDDDVVMANLRMTDQTKDHDADLVVPMPDVGVLVFEVKGGSVWLDEGWRSRGQGLEVLKPSI